MQVWGTESQAEAAKARGAAAASESWADGAMAWATAAISSEKYQFTLEGSGAAVLNLGQYEVIKFNDYLLVCPGVEG